MNRKRLVTLLAALAALLLCAIIILFVGSYTKKSENPKVSAETVQTDPVEQTAPVQDMTTVPEKETEFPETTSPGETTEPTESTKSAEKTKPTESSTSAQSVPKVDTSVSPVPPDMTEATVPPATTEEPPATTEPPAPTEPPQKDEPEGMTYEKYTNMSGDEQRSYRESFASVSAFFDWYNAEKAEYDAKNSGAVLEDGTLDLENVMNGSAGE